MTTSLAEQNDNWVLTLPKKYFQKDTLIRLLEVIQLEELSQRNQMTEEQAWQVSEDIKSSWWSANSAEILAKIQTNNYFHQ